MPTAKFNDLPETQRTALTEQFFQNFQFWDELTIDMVKIAFMEIFGDEPGTSYSIGGGNEYLPYLELSAIKKVSWKKSVRTIRMMKN